MNVLIPNEPLPSGPRPSATLPASSEWTFELLDEYATVIAATAYRRPHMHPSSALQ
jgi:CO dehydrogenase/acetyl-CoA synthase alpha subunit